MKEYNVLEASGLCVNGNPVTHEPHSITQILFRVTHMLSSYDIKPPYEKGTHVRRPLGEYPEPIIMPDGKKQFIADFPYNVPDSHGDIYTKGCWDNYFKTMTKKGHQEYIQGLNKMTESKRYSGPRIDHSQVIHREPDMIKENKQFPEPRNPPKPPPKKIPIVTDSVVWPNENIKFDCLSGNYKKATFGDFKKALIGKSWFSKVKKWLKYWFTPREPYNKIVEGYRNSREFNEAINKISQSIKFPGHSSPPKPPQKFSDLYSDDYYKRKAKDAESDQIKRAQKLGHALKYATIQSDQLGKPLIRMRRRKKRYSISTPITRAIK